MAVLGGGPAGSFFAYFLLKTAEQIGLELAVDIYEPRSFARCGPAGCNHCGGIVSESLVQILATEGIILPPEVVQRGIESYQVHLDVGSVTIGSPASESRIAALYRGNGPREGAASPSRSFDGYLQDLAGSLGAQTKRELVLGIDWQEPLPRLTFADGKPRPYELVAVASGVNSNLLGRLRAGPDEFQVPHTTRTFICEFRVGAEAMGRLLGSAVHVFLLDIPRLEFAAVIPKGEFATFVLVGEDLDQELVSAFLNDPVVLGCFPTRSLPCVCSCNPLINMGAKSAPFADRIVMVGDSGVTRLYKDGIGSAYRTAKAAATTAVLHGVSRAAFQAHFWPACQLIARDNAVGRVMFMSTALLKRFRFTRAIIHRMALREQSSPTRPKHMSSLLWNMFTGSAPYMEMFRNALRPGFIGNLALTAGALMLPPGLRPKAMRP